MTNLLMWLLTAITELVLDKVCEIRVQLKSLPLPIYTMHFLII